MNAENAPRKKMKPIVIILIILAALFVLCLIIGLISSGSPSGKATSTARSMTETIAAIPTETPIPTAAIPTPTFDPQAGLRKGLTVVLGSSNRNVERLRSLVFDVPNPGDVYIEWSINDNLTEDLIKASIKSDATELLKFIDQVGYPYNNVILYGYFPLVDVYGKSTEENVVKLVFYPATIQKIEWYGFNFENIYTIADESEIAPAVQ